MNQLFILWERVLLCSWTAFNTTGHGSMHGSYEHPRVVCIRNFDSHDVLLSNWNEKCFIHKFECLGVGVLLKLPRLSQHMFKALTFSCYWLIWILPQIPNQDCSTKVFVFAGVVLFACRCKISRWLRHDSMHGSREHAMVCTFDFLTPTIPLYFRIETPKIFENLKIFSGWEKIWTTYSSCKRFSLIWAVRSIWAWAWGFSWENGWLWGQNPIAERWNMCGKLSGCCIKPQDTADLTPYAHATDSQSQSNLTHLSPKKISITASSNVWASH